jgi:DNA-binding XRE family transcriptional regulator
MTLDDWSWKNKMTAYRLAKIIGVSTATISLLRNQKHTSSLLTAIKLHEVTKGEVSFEYLLKADDLKEYEIWLSKYKENAKKK